MFHYRKDVVVNGKIHRIHLEAATALSDEEAALLFVHAAVDLLLCSKATPDGPPLNILPEYEPPGPIGS